MHHQQQGSCHDPLHHLRPAPDRTPMLPFEPGDGLISERRGRYSEQLGADTLRFRELIGKLGSGERTSTGLSREEAAEALDRLLQGRVSDAQAAAFLISHRLRRPEPQELAGLIDSYRRQGPTLQPAGRRVVSFGVPFDGRCRTAPVLPLTALLLASAGLGVVLHGGEPMPVKYGLSNGEALAALGLQLRRLDWPAVQAGFASCGLALLHQPRHFAAAERLIPIRCQIGKRPPIATLELLWSCCPQVDLQVSGFVHAPTEALAWEALAAVGQAEVLMIKGLEGGVDLPTSRVAIAAHRRAGQETPERLLLQARDHGLRTPEVELTSLEAWRDQALAALVGKGPLRQGLIWNGGFQLWRAGLAATLAEGVEQAEALLAGGTVERWRQACSARLERPRRCFAFEADFVADLRCLPMAVRRKLDLAGVKLKLSHWHGLDGAEREQLLAWDDDPASIAALRQWLLQRCAALPPAPPTLLEPARKTAWQQQDELPAELLASCEQLGLRLAPRAWGELDELERFALVKLSHPGHEHHNLPKALAEFGLLASNP